jgi:hypothetical protein
VRHAASALAEPGRSLLIVISAVHLSIAQFIRGTLPVSDFLVTPPTVFLLLILFLLVIPTAVVFLAGWAVRHYLGPHALAAFHAGLMAIAVVLMMHQAGLYLPRLNDFVSDLHHDVPVGAAAGGLAACLTAGWLTVRFRATAESLFVWFAPMAVLLTFILAGWQSGQNAAYAAYSDDAVSVAYPRKTPVFVIVLDELSYDTLLEASGEVDRRRFPAFARLADNSVSFENATSNFFHTRFVVSRLVDSALPLASEFKIRLALQYHRVLKLYAPRCGETYSCRGAHYVSERETWELTKDQAVRTVSRMVPRWLLGLSGGAGVKLFNELHAVPQTTDPPSLHAISEELFEAFVQDIDAIESRGRLHFLHIFLPHWPYIYDPAGRLATLDREAEETEWLQLGETGTDVTWSDRLLDQTAFLDGLMGRFIDRLEAEGLYDDAIIIVTADHGARPEWIEGYDSPIELPSVTPRVPLFIKAPELAGGTTSSVDYQHVDFGATLYDLLDVEDGNAILEETIDDAAFGLGPGVSAFSIDRPKRKKAFLVDSPSLDRYWRYELNETTQRWEVVQTFNEPIPDRTRAAP